jgi:hypothetical protein
MKEAKAKSKSEGSASSARGAPQNARLRGTPQFVKETKYSQGAYGAASECSTAACSFASNCAEEFSEVIPNIPISRSSFYGVEESESSASEFTNSEAGTSFCSSRAPTSFCSSIQENEVESFTDKVKKMFWKRNQDDEAEMDLGGLRVSVKNTFLDFQDEETGVLTGLRKSNSAEGRLGVLQEDEDVHPW